MACWRRHEAELALAAAQTAAQLLAHSAIDVFARFQAYAGVAEVFLALWENSQDLAVEQTKIAQLRANAQQNNQAFWKFTRVYPIGRPQAWL
jgi:hypothetical protein